MRFCKDCKHSAYEYWVEVNNIKGFYIDLDKAKEIQMSSDTSCVDGKYFVDNELVNRYWERQKCLNE